MAALEANVRTIEMEGLLWGTGKLVPIGYGIKKLQVINYIFSFIDHYPFRSALTWIEDNDLLNVCLKDGFDACCYRINGGWNGKVDRDEKYAIAKKVFGVN